MGKVRFPLSCFGSQLQNMQNLSRPHLFGPRSQNHHFKNIDLFPFVRSLTARKSSSAPGVKSGGDWFFCHQEKRKTVSPAKVKAKIEFLQKERGGAVLRLAIPVKKSRKIKE